MKRTVVGLFKSLEQARGAIKEIGEKKLANNEISIVLRPKFFRNEFAQELTALERKDVLKDFHGILVRSGAIDVPGLGEVEAAGPLAGSLIRENDKGLAENLQNYGISSEQADYLTSKVREGQVLVVISTEQEKVNLTANFLSAFGASEVEKWSDTIDHPLYPQK